MIVYGVMNAWTVLGLADWGELSASIRCNGASVEGVKILKIDSLNIVQIIQIQEQHLWLCSLASLLTMDGLPGVDEVFVVVSLVGMNLFSGESWSHLYCVLLKVI